MSWYYGCPLCSVRKQIDGSHSQLVVANTHQLNGGLMMEFVEEREMCVSNYWTLFSSISDLSI